MMCSASLGVCFTRAAGARAGSFTTLLGTSCGNLSSLVSTHVMANSGSGESVSINARPTWPAPQIQRSRVGFCKGSINQPLSNCGSIIPPPRASFSSFCTVKGGALDPSIARANTSFCGVGSAPGSKTSVGQAPVQAHGG